MDYDGRIRKSGSKTPSISIDNKWSFSSSNKYVSMRGWILVLVPLLLLFSFGVYIYFESAGHQRSCFPSKNVRRLSSVTGMDGTRKAAVDDGDRVAICLAGELNRFELTGPTLETYLFSAYPNSEVFVVTSFDANAYKLWVIGQSRIAGVHIVKQSSFPEDEILKFVVHPRASSSGRQGIIRHSVFIEKCAIMIRLYEQKYGFKYDWVVRTRPDGLWSQRPPPLSDLSTHQIYVPKGSDRGGLNDRFTIGTRNMVLKSMKWTSSLPTIFDEHKMHLMEEVVYKEVLRIFQLLDDVARLDLSFCVLTDEAFPWPLKWQENPSFSASVSPIDAPGDGGGRYCRPCVPLTERFGSDELALEYYHTTTFCNSNDPNFAPNWPQKYDNFYGPDIAAKRANFESNDNFWVCIRFFEKMFLEVDFWFGEQDPYPICSKHFNPTVV